MPKLDKETAKRWGAVRSAMDAIGRGVCGIYRFTCNRTGNVYVGQAKDVAIRIQQHARDADNLHVASTAWHKALAAAGGVSAFVIEVLERLPREAAVLTERENYWLNFHGAGTSINCYNTHGRAGLSPIGSEVPAVVYDRVRAALTGRARPEWVKAKISFTKLTPNGRARNSAANKGRKHSPEVIAKYREAQNRPDILAANRARLVGKKLSPEHIEKMKAAMNTPDYKAACSARLTGREVTKEQRERIRSALLGVKHTEERRKNQSDARKRFLAAHGSPFLGKKHSEESRAKMRASRLAYFSRLAQELPNSAPTQ